MSLIFSWKKRTNAGIALILVGLAGVMQSILVLNAETTLEITSIYILILVPLGVSLALGGIEMVLAEAIYRRFSARERRPTKWKVRGRSGIHSLMGKLEVAAIISLFLVVAFSLVSYFAVVGALVGTAVPYFARFVLAEIVSMLVAFFAGIIIRKII
jgi:hypothetical protein